VRHSLHTGRAAAIVLALSTGAFAAEPPAPGWYSTADLSFVLTAGNTRASTLGAKLTLDRRWVRTTWRNSAAFVRTAVGDPTRRAVGTSAANAELEDGPRVTKAEKIYADSNLERRVTERFFWNAGGTFDRDVFAGVESRLLAKGGVGYLWDNREFSRFATGVAATFTSQNDVVDDPATEDTFVGLQLNADAERRFGGTHQNVFASKLIVDENLQDTDDLRFNWDNSLSVAMNRRLALKFGVVLAFDNLPAFVEFPLFIPTPQGLVESNILVPGRAEKLDMTATVALVINFTPRTTPANP
jgi:putative salt-induced outer membrane protein YdiY